MLETYASLWKLVKATIVFQASFSKQVTFPFFPIRYLTFSTFLSAIKVSILNHSCIWVAYPLQTADGNKLTSSDMANWILVYLHHILQEYFCVFQIFPLPSSWEGTVSWAVSEGGGHPLSHWMLLCQGVCDAACLSGSLAASSNHSSWKEL